MHVRYIFLYTCIHAYTRQHCPHAHLHLFQILSNLQAVRGKSTCAVECECASALGMTQDGWTLDTMWMDVLHCVIVSRVPRLFLLLFCF